MCTKVGYCKTTAFNLVFQLFGLNHGKVRMSQFSLDSWKNMLSPQNYPKTLLNSLYKFIISFITFFCLENSCSIIKQLLHRGKSCKYEVLLSFQFVCHTWWLLYFCFQYGEIDCWAMECPPLTCTNPILNPGDCCPRCQDDPCGLDSTNSSLNSASGGRPCTYLGHLYESGSQWKDPYDKCTACNCKVS